MKTWIYKLPKAAYLASMFLGIIGGSFCGVILGIGWLAALGLTLFLLCWFCLSVGGKQ